MKQKEDIGLSPLEDNKLFFMYDGDSLLAENDSGEDEKIFIFHVVNKFGYVEQSVVKDGFDKINFNLDDYYLGRNIIGPFSSKSELEICIEKLLTVLGYKGAILLSLKEFNNILKSSKDIQEVKESLFEVGKSLRTSKKDGSSKSFMKKIFG